MSLEIKAFVKHLEKRVSRSLGIIRKLKNYQPQHAFFKLHNTLVHSHLIYEPIVWRNTYPTYLCKLITIQNKALRIVTESGWYENALPLSGM